MLLVVFGMATGFAMVLTPAAARLARATGTVDSPGDGKLHAVATPLLGGLVVCAAAFLAALVSRPASGFPEGSLGLLAGALVALAVGLWDDRFEMGVSAKLAGQTLAAWLAVWGHPPDLGLPPVANVVAGMVFLIALMNAVNFLDNMNGMAAGLTAIALAGFAWDSASRGQGGLAAVQLALAGACAGFLPHNFPRARIFLGDAGSLVLGYSLGASAVLAQTGLPRGWGQIGPLFLIGYPLFDLAFVTVSRLREGRPVHEGGRDHTNHRLSTLLRCHKKTVILTWAAGAALCASGLAVQRLNQAPTTLALSVLWATTLSLAALRLSSVPRGARRHRA